MAERVELRRSERHRVRFHLVYDDGASFNAGTVHDVSEAGLFLETALPLPPGTEVRLVPLDARGKGLFEIRARVTRTLPHGTHGSGPPGMGLEFLGLEARDREAVSTLIRELEAQAGQDEPYLGVHVPGGGTPTA